MDGFAERLTNKEWAAINKSFENRVKEREAAAEKRRQKKKHDAHISNIVSKISWRLGVVMANYPNDLIGIETGYEPGIEGLRPRSTTALYWQASKTRLPLEARKIYAVRGRAIYEVIPRVLELLKKRRAAMERIAA